MNKPYPYPYYLCSKYLSEYMSQMYLEVKKINDLEEKHFWAAVQVDKSK